MKSIEFRSLRKGDKVIHKDTECIFEFIDITSGATNCDINFQNGKHCEFAACKLIDKNDYKGWMSLDNLYYFEANQIMNYK